jgi:hypothetical protein
MLQYWSDWYCKQTASYTYYNAGAVLSNDAIYWKEIGWIFLSGTTNSLPFLPQGIFAKESTLRQEPQTLKACAEWLKVLNVVETGTETITAQYQKILDFFILMTEFGINNATVDVVGGCRVALNSLLGTAGEITWASLNFSRWFKRT